MDVTSEPQTKGFHNDSFIPTLTTYEYRGYMIGAWARPEFANGFTSVGIVYERSKLGSIISRSRIEGESLESKEQAEQHGVELCKEWIDKQFRA
jgi:hypothetical protein